MLVAAELVIVSGPLQWIKLENILCFKGRKEFTSCFWEEEILNNILQTEKEF